MPKILNPDRAASLAAAGVTVEASNATPTPVALGKHSRYHLTALAAGAVFAAPSGTVMDGDAIVIRIKDNGTARTLGWNAIYRDGFGATLPTTTVPNKTVYVGLNYNATDTKWDVIAVSQEA